MTVETKSVCTNDARIPDQFSMTTSELREREKEGERTMRKTSQTDKRTRTFLVAMAALAGV